VIIPKSMNRIAKRHERDGKKGMNRIAKGHEQDRQKA
jgi:hypothetical protein